MPQRRHRQNRPRKHKGAAAPAPIREPLPVLEKKKPVVYGKAFIVLEDTQKKTFVFKGGQWISHSMSIAECKESGQVKELPQRVNRMIRYEVCLPVSVST
jgi:hypothetical protein